MVTEITLDCCLSKVSVGVMVNTLLKKGKRLFLSKIDNYNWSIVSKPFFPPFFQKGLHAKWISSRPIWAQRTAEEERGGNMGIRAFTVVSLRRNMWGRESRLGLTSAGSGVRGVPRVWFLTLQWLEQGRVAQVWESDKQDGGNIGSAWIGLHL